MDLPQLNIEVDRTSAARLKLTQTDVVRNVITALMSSAQLAPNFWIDPDERQPLRHRRAISGARRGEHPDAGECAGVVREIAGENQRRRCCATWRRSAARKGRWRLFIYDADRVSQLFVSVGDSNLARVAGEIDRIVEELPLTYAVMVLPKKALFDHAIKVCPPEHNPREDPVLEELLQDYFHGEDPEVADQLRRLYRIDAESLHLGKDPQFRERLEGFLALTKASEKAKARAEIQREFGVDPEPLRLPKGVRVTLRGEVASMRESFAEMGFNLALAVLLVYLVMAAQFSSWLDPAYHDRGGAARPHRRGRSFFGLPARR